MSRSFAIDPGFSTESMSAIFSSEQRVARMLEVEVALAAAQADVGIVPMEAARAIEDACGAVPTDVDALFAQGWKVGTVVLPLLEQVCVVLEPSAVPYLHCGATTQDIVDTALALQMKDGLDVVTRTVDSIIDRCQALHSQYGTLPVVGRTFLQPAIATTFGARVRRWSAAFERARARLENAASRLPIQLGGPVGDPSGRAESGPRVAVGLGRRLGLRVPDQSWHTDRTPILDSIMALHGAVSAASKCGLDAALLTQPEIREVEVRSGVPATTPHKRNPVDALRALAAAEAFQGAASVMLRAAPPALERGLGAWHAETFAVPLCFCTGAAALEAIDANLEYLRPTASMATPG